MPSTVWIQFVKMPVIGKVKTRLAKTIGHDAALAAHNRLSFAVNTQLANFIGEGDKDQSNQLWLGIGAADGSPSEGDYERALDVYRQQGMRYQHVFLQHGDSLGGRMCKALGMGLEMAEQAFIVGSDFPVLDRNYLCSAVNALRQSDVVLGSTEDGGYGLIGVNRQESKTKNGHLAFEDFGEVSWGTDKVCQQTQRAMQLRGLEVALLEKRFDVDEEKDWRRWLASAWCV